MSDLLQDLRFSFRQMRQSPGFTLAVVLCLALGIGANSATFSFANALLRDRPGVAEPERLVRLLIQWTNGPEFGSLSYPDYVDLRDHVQGFSGLAVGALRPLHLSGEGRNERLWALVVSGDYFRVLGTEIRHGRDFLAEEDRTPGTHPVAILSHGLWRRRFGSDPEIIGQSVLINGRPFTIVGVTPRSFRGANAGLAVDLWVPIMMQEALVPGQSLLEARGTNWLSFNIGRLRPGVTIAQAQVECDAIMAQLIAAYPGDNVGKNVVLLPESKSSLHPMVRGGFVGFLGLMFGVVGLILLLACFNVAGLLLARSVARSREIAIRLALGAGRRRLVRQLFTESVVLALAAGGAGLLIGVWLTRVMQSVQPPGTPLDVAAELNGAVLAFTFLAALLTAVVFGLA
ncbi:MAG: FtsX-like permease family protein, partial [bacterium]|nr:FtsX-like permease family protein [bacterium]